MGNFIYVDAEDIKVELNRALFEFIGLALKSIEPKD